jgi:hypothetical protein
MMGPKGSKGSKKSKPDAGTSTVKISQKKVVLSDTMKMLILATKNWNKNLSGDILVVLENIILKDPPRFTPTQFILKLGQCNRDLRENCWNILRNEFKIEKEEEKLYAVPGWTTLFMRKKKNERMLTELRRARNSSYTKYNEYGDENSDNDNNDLDFGDDNEDDEDEIQYNQIPQGCTNYATCPNYPRANLPVGFPWIPDYKDSGKSGRHENNGNILLLL